MRALIVTRLSKVTEATTSPERQREAGEGLCQQRDWTVVGYASDLDTSGSADPFRRPELGAWLASPDDFDILVVYRLDRLTRSLKDLTNLMEWADTHGISIVSATEPFDTSTAIGSMIPKITAMVAELELDAISTRNAAAFDSNIRAGKYRGGVCPFGYRPVQVDGEWRYIPDPVLAPLVRDIAERITRGASVRSIVRELNDQGVPTPKDQNAIDTGKSPKGYAWSVGNLLRSLQSPTLLGYAMRSQPVRTANGKEVKTRDRHGNLRKQYGPKEIIRDGSGEPVVRSEALISLADYQKLQDALASRKGATPQRVDNATLLLGVMLCGVCGRKMYRLARSNGRSFSYRCSSAQYGTQCSNGTIQAKYADPIVSDMLLRIVGNLPFSEREFVPGDDHAAELEAIDAELTAKLDLIGKPGFRTGPMKDSLDSTIAELGARREDLDSRPHRESGYRFVPTGETFAQHWEDMDDAEQNAFLTQYGVTVKFTAADRGKRHRPNVMEPVEGEGWAFEFGRMVDLIAAVSPGLDVEGATEDPAAFARLVAHVVQQ